MKKTILILLLLSVMPNLINAQNKYKLVETSAKDKPSWIYSRPMGYYMVSTDKAVSVDDAQQKVMTSLTNQIASSVAVSITSTTTSGTEWNDDEYKRKMESIITTKVGKMPALQGISITKADVYWESYIDKKTKEIFYDYYILYPFPSSELNRLIDEYNAHEKAVNDRIDNYKTALDDINDVELILNNISEMKSMIKEVGEDDHAKCNKLNDNISLYEKVLDKIYIDVMENSGGLLVIQLKYDEKVMNTKSLPKLKGDCSKDFNRKHNGNKIDITFNTFDCYEQDDNYVEIRFTFGKKRVVKKVCINL